jgi:hypothetical protein
MLLTSMTTCLAFLSLVLTPIPTIQTFGVFAALVIAINYLLCITMTLGAVMIFHNHFDRAAWQLVTCHTPMGHCSWGVGCKHSYSCKPRPTTSTEHALRWIGAGNPKPEPLHETFFRARITPLVLDCRVRAALALTALAWLLPATTFALRLAPARADSSTQYFSKDHPVQQALDIATLQAIPKASPKPRTSNPEPRGPKPRTSSPEP